MDTKKIKLKDCIIEATIPNGEVIQFEQPLMRYDPFDDIYWYKDQALSYIKILGPDLKEQDKFKTFS